jgi:hypothetical protein
VEALKTLLFIAASGMAVGGGLYAGGILSKGEVYDLPVADVRSRLMTLSLSPETLAIAGGSDKANVTVNDASDAIAWSVSTGGNRAAKFTVNLRAEGPSRTRVTINYMNGRSTSNFADRLTSTRFFRSYAETSFAEEVDARLDGRPVDQRKARHDFATRAAADPQQVRELGLASASIFNDVTSQVYETAGNSDEIGPSARARGEAMKTAPRASVVLPDKN